MSGCIQGNVSLQELAAGVMEVITASTPRIQTSAVRVETVSITAAMRTTLVPMGRIAQTVRVRVEAARAAKARIPTGFTATIKAVAST
jgi:hypothetical protein